MFIRSLEQIGSQMLSSTSLVRIATVLELNFWSRCYSGDFGLKISE